jgi:ketosteroid isomerase-like protein
MKIALLLSAAILAASAPMAAGLSPANAETIANVDALFSSIAAEAPGCIVGIAQKRLGSRTFSNDEASAQHSKPDDVELVVRHFLVPFSNRDVAAYITYFADDATIFFPPSKPGAPATRVSGRVDIEREFRQGNTPPSQLRLIEPQDLIVQHVGEGTAVATFHLGTASRGQGRRTFVFRRIGSEWKIAHLHASDFVIPSR